MNRKVLLVLMGIVLVTLLAACGNLPAGRAAQQPVFTPPETIDDFSIQETVDLEELFKQTYQTRNLTSQRDLNLEQIGVKFMSWSPNAQYTLLRIATGDVLEGKNANDPPSMGITRVGDYDLWLADSKGTPEKQLASSTTWTAWSPDSKSVAYVYRNVIDGIFTHELWVTNINQGKPIRLSDRAHSISWLDDHTILFAGFDGHLYTVDTTSRVEQPFIITGEIENEPYISVYELSPEQNWLVFQARGEARFSIAKIKDNAGEIVQHIERPDSSPISWSPNGEMFAFEPRCHPQRLEPACTQIYVVQTDGLLVAQIEHNSRTNIAWSPNSSLILFRDDETLYLGEIATQQVYALSLAETEFSGLSWSPDGQFIAYNRTPTSGAMLLTLVEKQ